MGTYEEERETCGLRMGGLFRVFQLVWSPVRRVSATRCARVVAERLFMLS